MASTRESVMTVVLAALAAALPTATVARDVDEVVDIPAGGLLVVRAEAPEIDRDLLGGGPYWHRQPYTIEVYAEAPGDGVARFALHDDLLVGIATAVVADRTFGGNVRGCELTFDDLTEQADDGAATARIAVVRLVCEYSAATEI
jgi:hypothetical protein